MGVGPVACRCTAGKASPKCIRGSKDHLQGSRLTSCSCVEPQRPGLDARVSPELQQG